VFWRSLKQARRRKVVVTNLSVSERR